MDPEQGRREIFRATQNSSCYPDCVEFLSAQAIVDPNTVFDLLVESLKTYPDKIQLILSILDSVTESGMGTRWALGHFLETRMSEISSVFLRTRDTTAVEHWVEFLALQARKQSIPLDKLEQQKMFALHRLDILAREAEGPDLQIVERVMKPIDYMLQEPLTQETYLVVKAQAEVSAKLDNLSRQIAVTEANYHQNKTQASIQQADQIRELLATKEQLIQVAARIFRQIQKVAEFDPPVPISAPKSNV